MVPAHLIPLDALPLTPNGKIDRQRLAARPLEDEQSEAQESTAARDEVEAYLLDYWSKLLGKPVTDIHTDFFALGGYSLLAIRMFTKLKRYFGKDLPVSLLMEAPTIAQLAERIRSAEDASGQIIYALQPAGDKTPLYCVGIHRYGVVLYRHLVQHFGTDRPILGISLPDDGQEFTIPVEEQARLLVEALLERQPHGPYYLCGVSFAGVLAYEMARQLRDRGITENHVLLIDTIGPDYPPLLPLGKALVHHFATDLRHIMTPNPKQSMWQMQELLWRQRERLMTWGRGRVDRVWNKLKQRFPSLAQAGPQQPLAREEDDDALLSALVDRYFEERRPHTGAVVVFRATLQPLRTQYTRTMGWGEVVKTGVTVIDVRGTHFNCFLPPYAAGTTAKIKAWLDRQA